MYKILIVEDDFVIAQAIEKHLESWGFQGLYVSDLKNIMGAFVEYSPHLVLLDVSLPFYNGYHWCNEIRKVSKVPIIFVSSSADQMNIVMAMNLGGDDFIAKPFDLTVLTAKIQAILRRTYDFAGKTSLLEHEGVILNMDDTTLNYTGHKIDLTKNEYKIIQLLMENKGRVVSRNAIMSKLWESDDFVDENTLTVNITRLRKKLEAIGLVDLIKTKKGMGYMIGD